MCLHDHYLVNLSKTTIPSVYAIITK